MARPVNTSSSNTVDRFFISLEQDFGVPQTVMRDNSCEFISLAYLVMFAMVFDYSRWISNWAVCLFLILHAVKALPASKDAPSISADDRKTILFGSIVTLIPRVGIVRPF